MLKPYKFLIFTLALPIISFAASTVDLIKQNIEDPNVEKAFIRFYETREEYFKTPQEQQNKIFKKVIDSSKCLNSLATLYKGSLYYPFLEKIETDFEKNPDYYQFRATVSREVKLDSPFRNEEFFKFCDFKIDQDALKQVQKEEAKNLNQIEDDYNALLDYKKRAHPAIQKIIPNFEGSPYDLIIQELKKSLQETSEKEKEKKDLIKAITLTYKENTFAAFSKMVISNDTSVANIVKKKFSKECQLQAHTVYKKNCEKNQLYSEIPGVYNRLKYCLNDFKTETNKDCNDLLATF